MTILIERRRANPTWLAALVHRLSGMALAAFLPIHFYVLALALDGPERLDGFLRWTDMPPVKLTEAVLIFLLVVHVLGGARLLLLENFSWRGGQARMAVAAAGLAVVLAAVFLARVL